MSELTDDQLDGLFRKSAEEFDPPYDPAAWQDMKTRLDTHDRPASGGTPLWKNLLRWGLPVCLLLLLVGGLYMYRHNADRRGASLGKVATTQLPNTGNTATKGEVDKASTKQPTTSQRQPTDTDFASTTKTAVGDLAAGDSDIGSPTAGLPAKSVDLTMQSTGLTKPVAEKSAIDATPARPLTQPDGLAKRAGRPNTSVTTDETNAPSVAYGQKTNPANHESDLADKTSPILRGRSAPKTYNARSNRKRMGTTATKQLVTKKQKQTEWLFSQPQLTGNDAIISASVSKKRSVKTATDEVQLAVTSNSTTSYQPMIGQAERTGLPDVRELASRPANWPKQLVFTERPINVPSVKAELKPTSVVSEPLIDKGLSVRLAIAPDLSSIGLRNFARPGTNVGLMLEYRLAPRWSVQTGIIQSTKIYKASAADYELPDYYQKGMYTIPQGADGQCKMLDIPINVRYDVLLKPRTDGRSPSRWFVSGGVTSYIIEREDYVYKYTGYAHKPIPDWSGKSGSYGLSQLNLSVGYERALTKRLSWQVEPFMKMPLRKVGYLNLNLLSTGAFFSIRYKL